MLILTKMRLFLVLVAYASASMFQEDVQFWSRLYNVMSTDLSLPHVSPTASPTIRDASAAPSLTPSVPPSSSHSLFPSTASSDVPSYSNAQAAVEIHLRVTFFLDRFNVLNLPVDNALVPFKATIATPIYDLMASNGTFASVTVTNVDGLPVRRRLLNPLFDPFVQVNLLIHSKQDCYHDNCTTSVDQYLQRCIDLLNTHTGTLTISMHQIASEKKQKELQNAIVREDSFRILDFNFSRAEDLESLSTNPPFDNATDTSDAWSTCIGPKVTLLTLGAVLMLF